MVHINAKNVKNIEPIDWVVEFHEYLKLPWRWCGQNYKTEYQEVLVFVYVALIYMLLAIWWPLVTFMTIGTRFGEWSRTTWMWMTTMICEIIDTLLNSHYVSFRYTYLRLCLFTCFYQNDGIWYQKNGFNMVIVIDHNTQIHVVMVKDHILVFPKISTIVMWT